MKRGLSVVAHTNGELTITFYTLIQGRHIVNALTTLPSWKAFFLMVGEPAITLADHWHVQPASHRPGYAAYVPVYPTGKWKGDA